MTMRALDDLTEDAMTSRTAAVELVGIKLNTAAAMLA
jgi:hypothetical protein